MRILVVNVNTTESMTDSIGRQAAAAASPGTEIIALTPLFGADSVEGNYESYLAAIGVMETVRAYTEPFDAVIQAGSPRDRLTYSTLRSLGELDPATDAMVLGLAEAAPKAEKAGK